MKNKIVKNVIVGAVTAVSFAAVGAGAYAVIDCANKAHADAMQEQDKEQESELITVSFVGCLGSQTSGITGTMADITTTADAPFVMPKNTYVANFEGIRDIRFLGWSITGNLNDPIYSENELLPDNFFEGKKAVTFRTVWAIQGYEIFDSVSKYIAVGDPANRVVDIPTREGYTFGGYFTGANGTGTMHYDSEGWDTGATASGAVNLYAYWIANAQEVTEYVIVWDANGGTGQMSNSVISSGTVTTFPEATYTRESWSFAGWATTPTDYQTIYRPGVTLDDSFLAGKDEKFWLYAVWEKIITIDLQGGSIEGVEDDTFNLNFIEGDAMSNIQLPRASRTGYTFAGYYTSPNGEGTQFVNEEGMLNSGIEVKTITLYAAWKATINLSSEGGSTSTPTVTGISGQQVMPTAQIPTREGYEFAGYFSEKNGAGTMYYDENCISTHTFDLQNSQNLYACWKITVFFDPQNGNDTLKVKYIISTDGTNLTAFVEEPTKANCVFGGYFTGKKGTGTKYFDSLGNKVGKLEDLAGNTTLYAYWIENAQSY